MSNPAVIFGRSLLPSIVGRTSSLGLLEPVNLCRPTGYCAGGRPSHLIFREQNLACVLTPLAAKDAEGSRRVHDGQTMEPPDALQTFRRSFYECFHRRRDALFELTDATLAADGTAPSPAHLSLQASHRRGWGSLYAALDRGRIDAEALRRLLVCHQLASGDEDEVPVYAVDTSVWPRCDAECSPQRGYYYHPSRHSAGQPI